MQEGKIDSGKWLLVLQITSVVKFEGLLQYKHFSNNQRIYLLERKKGCHLTVPLQGAGYLLGFYQTERAQDCTLVSMNILLELSHQEEQRLDSQVSGSFSCHICGPDLGHGKQQHMFVSCLCHCSLIWGAVAGGAISIRLNKPNSAKHLMFCA